MKTSIPARTVVTCDRCGKDVAETGRLYPKGATVTLAGNEEWCAWGFTKDLCPACADHVMAAVEAALKPA